MYITKQLKGNKNITKYIHYSKTEYIHIPTTTVK